jgi:hypothetical protein
MKHLFNKFKLGLTLTVAYCFLGATFMPPVMAAGHVSANMLNGSVATVYVGTSDTAVTWSVADTYTTNRTFIPFGASTAVKPLATNSISGAIYGSFERPVQIWANQDATPASNAAILVSLTPDAEYTATNITFHFVASGDGVTWDTGAGATGTKYFTFSFNPQSSANITTNLPAAFTTGAHSIRLWKIVSTANATDDGSIQINKMLLTGWRP